MKIYRVYFQSEIDIEADSREEAGRIVRSEHLEVNAFMPLTILKINEVEDVPMDDDASDPPLKTCVF